MFVHGFSVAPAIRIQAQMACAVLRKGFNGPTVQRQGKDPLGAPIDAIRHPHGIGARQLSLRETDHQPDLAQPGETYRQRKGPGCFVPYGHRPVCAGRHERHEVFHGNGWPFEPDGFACRLFEDEAVGLQMPSLLQQADPIFCALARHRNQLFRERPTVKQQDTQGELVLQRCFSELDTEVDCRAQLSVELLEVRVCEHERL
jgi:hypothetical protein